MAIKLSAWRWQDTLARPPPQNNSMCPFREGTAGAEGKMAGPFGTCFIRRTIHQRGVPKLEDGPILGIGERKLVRVRISPPRLIFYLTQISNYAMIQSWQKNNAK